MAILCTLGEGRYENLRGILVGLITLQIVNIFFLNHFSIHVLIYEHVVHLHLEVQCPLMRVNLVFNR